MASFVPIGEIRCGKCNEFFHQYITLENVFDADALAEISPNALKDKINRVTCTKCKTEFTYECTVMIHSYQSKTIACSNAHEYDLDVHNFPLALKIAGASDWNLRKCTFTMDAAEKMRIAKHGLCDGITEILKLRYFPEYQNMDLSDEYIVFESIKDDKLIFTHRDSYDNILDTYALDKSCYETISPIKIPAGDWQVIDREWAKNNLEENK